MSLSLITVTSFLCAVALSLSLSLRVSFNAFFVFNDASELSFRAVFCLVFNADVFVCADICL
jgi:hypothetical protein